MDEAVSLRAMRADDAGMVAALVQCAFAAQSAGPQASSQSPAGPPPSALRLTGSDVHAHLGGKAAGGAVAMLDGVLVGSIMWSDRDGGVYLERLAVHPDQRRRGIAKALLGAAEQAGRSRGTALLHLGTRLARQDNRRLFAGCGFVETSLHCHPGFAEPTWVRMEKVLA